MSLIWAWILSHPYISISVTTALASLAYKKLDAWPRTHAFMSLLAGLGIDLPTILDAIRRLISGAPPTLGKTGPYKKSDPDATQDPGKPLGRMRIEAALMPWPVFGFCAVGFLCILSPLASTEGCTPAAIAAEQVIANIADGACTQLDAQPEPGWVYFVCALVQTAGSNVTSLTVKVPADQAPKFASTHPRAQVSDELAVRLKGVEHLALPPKGGKL